MIRWTLTALLYLAANALALWIADQVLDDMSVTSEGFVLAVVIFTGVEVLISPLLTQMSLTGAGVLRGSVAVVVTFVGLLVTALVTETVTINGVVTWISATVIVWLGGLIAGLLVPLIVVKKAAGDPRGAR